MITRKIAKTKIKFVQSFPQIGKFNNCKRHKNKVIDESLICKNVIRTGINKGATCGRYKCKIHTKNIEV